MTHDPIRTKLIELVPEILSECVVCGSKGDSGCLNPEFKHTVVARDITLADVLRAIPAGVYLKSLGKQVRFVTYDDSGEGHPGIEYWDLLSDYDSQEQPVKDFVGRLLGVTDNTVT